MQDMVKVGGIVEAIEQGRDYPKGKYRYAKGDRGIVSNVNTELDQIDVLFYSGLCLQKCSLYKFKYVGECNPDLNVWAPGRLERKKL